MKIGTKAYVQNNRLTILVKQHKQLIAELNNTTIGTINNRVSELEDQNEALTTELNSIKTRITALENAS